jgi:hypothetical protein
MAPSAAISATVYFWVSSLRLAMKLKSCSSTRSATGPASPDTW